MKKRIITGIILVGILVPLILIGDVPFHIMMVFFVLVGAHEMFDMFSRKKEFPVVPRVVCTILAVTLYAAAVFNWNVNEGSFHSGLIVETNQTLPSYVAVLLISMLVIFGMLVGYDDFTAEDVGKCLLVMNYVALGCASMAILRELGVRFISYLFIVAFSTDVFAFLFGIKFGKHKMAPTISPKKSWEGAIAGTFFATILGTLFAFFYGNLFQPGSIANKSGEMTLLQNFCSLGETQNLEQLFTIIFITLCASILGQIGDLVASKMKRNYEIKDFGKIFPGHGGVLDRFDSSIFVGMFLVAIFIILRAIFPL